jgi:hypothetical protein
MKAQGASADATDLLEEIKMCLTLTKRGEAPTFQIDLQSRLVREVLAEIRSGRIESYGFERLIQTVLMGPGAEEVRIVPRNEDKGADLVAMFRVADAFQQSIAVQAKHWQPEPPVGVDVAEQLIRGIEAESANLDAQVASPGHPSIPAAPNTWIAGTCPASVRLIISSNSGSEYTCHNSGTLQCLRQPSSRS